MVSGWQTKFSVSPGQGLWSLVLGPLGPDLGPGPRPELDKMGQKGKKWAYNVLVLFGMVWLGLAVFLSHG